MLKRTVTFLANVETCRGLQLVIPCETRGYRFQLVRLSGFVSRLYLRKYSMESFLISHTDRASMEGVQRRFFVRFDEKKWKWQDFENLWKLKKYSTPRPGSPKVYIGVLLFIHIRIKHILKVSNVVFWIKLMKNCQNYRLL